MAAKRHPKTDIPKQIFTAIGSVWPDGIVQIDCDLIEDSYFYEVYRKLFRSLSSIKGASLHYERGANEQRQWEDNWDSRWSDNLPIDDNTYSYHLFFICPDDKLFRYEVETEEPDEEDPDVQQTVAGHGFIGCVVGVSLLARFAIVGLNSFQRYENGGHTCPGLEVCVLDETGRRVTAEEYFRGHVGDGGIRLLHSLRDRIAKVLQTHHLTVLSEEDQQKAVPWLRASEEILQEEGPVTVKGAFFFEAL
jgi:hypothetical protein